MGAKQDFTLAPVHAHINLLGFALMTIFGIAYRVIPALAGNVLARAHFWLHQPGGLVLLIGLFLLKNGNMAPGVTAITMPVSSIVVFVGMACWAVNVFCTA